MKPGGGAYRVDGTNAARLWHRHPPLFESLNSVKYFLHQTKTSGQFQAGYAKSPYRAFHDRQWEEYGETLILAAVLVPIHPIPNRFLTEVRPLFDLRLLAYEDELCAALA